MQSVYIAATGMTAQELNVEVIANNIANLQTTGFKRSRAEFQDLLYQTIARVGTETTTQGNMLPVGIEIGAGVKIAGTPRIMTQGALLPTGNELDLAIRGDGFFRILLPDGRTAYTRDGSFQTDGQGRLVTVNGFIVQPPITFPQNSHNITINAQGQVSVIVGTDTTPTLLGQLDLANFINPPGLAAIGDNLFIETVASGTPQVGFPADNNGLGSLQQGDLEQSNVNPVQQIADLIAAQRAYEMNSKVIVTADTMYQTVANLVR